MSPTGARGYGLAVGPLHLRWRPSPGLLVHPEPLSLTVPSRKASFLTSPSYLRSPFPCFFTPPEHGPGAWAPTLTPQLAGWTDCFPHQPFCDHLCLEVVPGRGKNTVYHIYLFC